MADMDEVVEFVRAYVQAEFEERKASYAERNFGRYEEKKAKVLSFLESSVTTGFSRSAFESELYFSQYAQKAERLAPRALFQVKRRPDGKYGQLFQAYVGADQKEAETYSRTLFVARVGEAWKVVAIYALDEDAEEGEVAWERYQGAKLQHLGTVEEVLKLKPPADPAHLADYEAAEA